MEAAKEIALQLLPRLVDYINGLIENYDDEEDEATQFLKKFLQEETTSNILAGLIKLQKEAQEKLQKETVS